jgi:hypothetical protein
MSDQTSGPSGQAQGVPPGRPIVLQPTPPGLWMVLLGVAVGALAPLFGFLIGGAIGTTEEQANDPMFIALFLGILVGGIGVLVAIAGAVRLWRHFQHQHLVEEESTGAVPARPAP